MGKNNLKKAMSLFLAIVTAFGCLSTTVFAKPNRNKRPRQYSYIVLGDNTAEITGVALSPKDYNKKRLKLVIPGELGGRAVSSIGEDAFKSVKLPYSAVIPQSVNKIGDYAFAKTRLLKVALPNNLRTIGRSAFRDTDLSQVVFPASLISIGIKAFYNTDITQVAFPKNLKAVEDYAFSTNRVGMRSVSIPKKIKKIGYNAFASKGKRLKIIGHYGSLADALAEKYNYKFMDVSSKRVQKAVNYKRIVAKSCRTELRNVNSPSAGSLRINWNRTAYVNNMTGVARYKIMIADNPRFKNAKKRIVSQGYSCDVNRLKRSKTYYVKIRGVAEIRMKWFWGGGYSFAKDYNGPWSHTQAVKVL